MFAASSEPLAAPGSCPVPQHIAALQEGQYFSDIVGSAYYIAPEVLRRKYSKEAVSKGVVSPLCLPHNWGACKLTDTVRFLSLNNGCLAVACALVLLCCHFLLHLFTPSCNRC